MAKSDRGSGTLLGVMLIGLVGVLMGVVMVTGRVLLAQGRAQTAADIAALSGAWAANGFTTESVCGRSERAAHLNQASVEQCSQRGVDVEITAIVRTDVPFFSTATAHARAGPRDCVETDLSFAQ